MKTNQEQIIKALAGLVPEDAQKQVSEAVASLIENAVAELDAEYDAKLQETFKQVTEEKAEIEKVGEEGYAQAWEIITDLRGRLELQKEEFEQALEEGYEEAYQMLQEERAKNDSLEVELYDEYDKKLQEVKEYIVDKVDQFLQLQGDKYYEMAKRDALNDPAVVDQKLAFEKVLEIAANYLTNEDTTLATSSRLDEAQKVLDEQKAKIKHLEAKNMRLATENNKLNESVRQNQKLITESTEKAEKADKKERAEKAKKVEGRGQTILERQVVIGEDKAGETVGRKLNEEVAGSGEEESLQELQSDWMHLSGLVKKE